MNFTFDINSKGHLKRRESFDLEFKANFHLGNQLLEYCRSLVGMANNKGGQIIFGIQDKPRYLVGMTNEKFTTCDPAKINQTLMEYFSHEIEWEMDTLEFKENLFGRLRVMEAKRKPIICKKNGDKVLKEAAIYYRYRGETKEINFAELFDILQNERDKEKVLWMKHIEKIGTVGPQNIHLVDTYKGELHTDKGKILLDKELLDKIKFIKEGQFVEKGGAPTLRIVGEISGIIDTEAFPQTDKVYPFRAEEVQQKCKINQYDLQLILKEYKIKGNNKYHTEIKSGKKTSIHKYTEDFVQRLQKLITDDKEILKKLRVKAKNENQKKKK
ncbi:MAG TPA: hypothetical protein DDX39_09030 [Bacteroidales bacterium]|nr:MAG: hypothetical protein A2W98_06165 [Bacteroidetes bacterium GWF2_33_38]OFY74330.1 MAG: hypothetical protein A2265_09655 [Bacteroidetes bacterium RIFOXYA12_FULL_33_9]OFY88091.1 MAG: hypothetical protein A2236_06125 [Bacteroidetes bacterium RIFOXYA2_FULL_33_7]HBF88771.1 hypothetical protein [Bacteroidales bacterium]